jgi:uncharacterized membrane protein YfcA
MHLPPFSDLVALLLLGLLAGASGGLLGIGGSTVMIPGLVLLFGPHRQHLYQAAAMIVNFFVVAPSVLQHDSAGATFRPVTRWTIPSSIGGALAGVWLSDRPLFHGPGQGYLQIAFAAFLFYVVIYNLARLRSGKRLPPMDQAAAARLSRIKILALVGLPSGFFGGLLGVGGGLIAVPAQQLFLQIPLTNAIANSASTILWSSVVGAIFKNAQLTRHGSTIADSALLALCLAPTALIGAWYTAARVHRWPVRIIRLVFVVLLLYCGTRLLLAGWHQVQP